MGEAFAEARENAGHMRIDVTCFKVWSRGKILTRFIFLIVFCGISFGARLICAGQAGAVAADQSSRLSDSERLTAVQILRHGLERENRWVKVHAAEYLLKLSYPQGVREEFEKELQVSGNELEYRIGIWRVLALASTTSEERDEFVNKICVVARSESDDRLHAVEALGKLDKRVDEETAKSIEAWVVNNASQYVAFGRWVLANSALPAFDADDEEQRIVDLLKDEDPVARLRAGFVLGNLLPLSGDAETTLYQSADQILKRLDQDWEQKSSLEQLADAYVLAAAWASWDNKADASGDPGRARFRDALRRLSKISEPVANVYAATLAGIGIGDDRENLKNWLYARDADLRLTAAFALLQREREGNASLTAIDWIVITSYFLAMIGIGVFYAQRTATTDDFLLGGRHMNAWMVGLSLFATLLSTLTYLAVPGEMIRHGPIIVMGTASFPIVSWVVGWYIIPFFMRLNVTSAYEILEIRFGYPGRLLGTVMFLALRFFWMAVILFATANAVIVPLLGWGASATPWVCLILGILTVVYSSLGGFRAVVLTDVIQTGILLGGAIVALLVITVQLGGVSEWWPKEWDPQWTPIKFYDPSSPRTILMAVLGTGIWYICTAGSDQMAIQRYLATRDARSARWMFNVTLLMNLLSWGLLTALGFALLGFYRSHPEFLAVGSTVSSDADKLFPRFIAIGLPVGISGLLVAGLLAAAMSSLSSGINSSCAVISVDYLGRLGGPERRQPSLKETQLISWCVGGVAVLLSSVAGLVPGNLLDVVYRIGNLLVSPLFVLFFMALFVRKATWPATLVAVISSIVVAVVVAYGQLIGDGFASLFPSLESYSGSFKRVAALGVLWIMPLSLVTGVVCGLIGSAIGFGSVAPALPDQDAD